MYELEESIIRKSFERGTQIHLRAAADHLGKLALALKDCGGCLRRSAAIPSVVTFWVCGKPSISERSDRWALVF
jgi:hypothetical protein